MTLDPATKVNVEKAARRFASVFLVPAETVQAEIGRQHKSIGWGEFLDLTRIFGASVQALAYRCKDFGIFSAPRFRQLFREFARGGWRSPPYQEPEAIPGRRPTRFDRPCFRALSKGTISEARAAELLGQSVHELNRCVDVPPNLKEDIAGACVSSRP